MKNVIFCLALFLFQGLFAQIVNIPDAAFKNYLLSKPDINTNADAEIQQSEALAYSDSILCFGLQISDLTGIEAFVNLTFLSCSGNNLTSLDVSQNINLRGLSCASNQITELDVSACPYLELLSCQLMQLSSLDLSSHGMLKELNCYQNMITELTLTGCSELRELYCSSNYISTLDLTSNPLLEQLQSNGNPLGSLDLSQNPALRELRCVDNNLHALDLSNNPVLEILDCPFNQITELDLSGNDSLQTIYCFSNALTRLNVANGQNMNLDIFWASMNPSLTCIQVDDPAYSISNWTTFSFAFDPGVIFSTNCLNASAENTILPVKLSPNPSAGLVSITVPERMEYTLFSVDGVQHATGELKTGDQQVQLDFLPRGLYLLQLVSESGHSQLLKLQKD